MAASMPSPCSTHPLPHRRRVLSLTCGACPLPHLQRTVVAAPPAVAEPSSFPVSCGRIWSIGSGDAPFSTDPTSTSVQMAPTAVVSTRAQGHHVGRGLAATGVWRRETTIAIGLHPGGARGFSSAGAGRTTHDRHLGLPSRPPSCLCRYACLRCCLMDQRQRFGFEERGEAYMGRASRPTQNRFLVCVFC